MTFTNLKINTGYSFTKGIVDTKELIKKAKKLNLKTIAISDINNIFNAVNFYEEAINSGIKPIISSTVYYYDDSLKEGDPNYNKKYELSLYVKNKEGYINLNKLLTKMTLENNKDENSGILKSWLTKESTNGLIALSGEAKGIVGDLLIKNNYDAAKNEALFFKNAFNDNYYIELQRNGLDYQNDYIEKAINLCKELDLAPVATNPTLFLEKEDYLAHEIKTCISSKDKLYDLSRELKYNKEMYLKSSEQMQELFADIPQAIENTEKISKICNFQLSLGKAFLPKYPVKDGETENSELRKEALIGLDKRLKKLYPNEIDYLKNKENYKSRLEMELSVIEQMGFAGYFLVVSDFIKYSKNNDVPVGPGRGSGAGSLVAYSLEITDLDPLKYNLLFERFLNPERVSMPDFDIDFCPDGRGKVINYVKNKYGHDKVSQISTFGTMAARSSIKDVTKVLGYSHGLGDTISKLIKIPPAKAHEIDLKTFIFGNEEKGILPDNNLLELYNNEKDVKKIIDYALILEGQPRQVGMHAGGVLISPEPIENFTPLYKKDKNSDVVSQYDKDSVEKAGLVKFDFLGLASLTIINNAIKDINKENIEIGKEIFEIENITTDDPIVYQEIFAKGNTNGVFQFESGGMKSLFRKVQPDKFEDLIALNALYRPGPMDIIPDWIEAKNLPEEERPYIHPILKEALRETYGYMIYQEQVMQAAQIVAGYSLGGADILRRAMGKKKPEEMAKQRQIFIDGAAKNNIDEEKANEIFDAIDKFSGYGFNKSHAAAYSLVAYQTAYLKYYHTKFFIKAQLNQNLNDTDKLADIIKDAKNNNLTILPPDINKSFSFFEVDKDNIESLRYCLTALKGVGEQVSNMIVEIRKDGDFKGIFDFVERMPRGSISKRSLEPMIFAGLFDSLHSNRKELHNSLEDILKYHKRYHEKKEKEQDSQLIEIPLYRAEKGVRLRKKVDLIIPEIKEINDWDEKTKVIFEKTSFGYYFNSDPTADYIKSLNGFPAAMTPKELIKEYDSSGINTGIIYGVISNITPYKSKTGAHVVISNNDDQTQLMVKNEIILKNKELFKNDNFIAVNVSLFYSDDDSIKVSVKDAFSFDECFDKTIEKTFVGIEGKQEEIDKFNNICDKYPGYNQIKLCAEESPGQRRSKCILTRQVKLNLNMINELKNTFGDKWVLSNFKSNIEIKSNNYKNNKKFIKK